MGRKECGLGYVEHYLAYRELIYDQLERLWFIKLHTSVQLPLHPAVRSDPGPPRSAEFCTPVCLPLFKFQAQPLPPLG